MRVQLRIFSFLAVKTFDLGVQKNRLFEYPDHIFYICLNCLIKREDTCILVGSLSFKNME